MNDKDAKARLEQVAACQLIMEGAAEMLGFSMRDQATAALFTAAGAFASSTPREGEDPREVFLQTAAEAYDICAKHLAGMEKAGSADKAKVDLLSRMDPQGEVS